MACIAPWVSRTGLDALRLSLQVAGVGAGDEVLLPANFIATALAVSPLGARPVLVEVDDIIFNSSRRSSILIPA